MPSSVAAAVSSSVAAAVSSSAAAMDCGVLTTTVASAVAEEPTQEGCLPSRRKRLTLGFGEGGHKPVPAKASSDDLGHPSSGGNFLGPLDRLGLVGECLLPF